MPHPKEAAKHYLEGRTAPIQPISLYRESEGQGATAVAQLPAQRPLNGPGWRFSSGFDVQFWPLVARLPNLKSKAYAQ